MKKLLPLLLCLALGCVAPGLAQTKAGRPDSSFNSTGRKLIQLPQSFYFNTMEKGICMAKQDSAHLLYLYPHSTPLSDDFGVIRTDLNGNLDTTFGKRGVAVIDVAGLNADLPAVMQVMGGRIYLGGQGGDGNAVVVCLKPNGRLDSTFTGDGRLSIDLGRLNERVTAFSYLPGPPGKILVGISTDSSYGLALMYAGNGLLDPYFSGDGKHLLSVGKGRMFGMFWESAGVNAYLAGYSKANDTAHMAFTVMKVVIGANPTSTIKRFKLTKGNNFVNAVAVLPNGDMYLGGECREAATGKTYGGLFCYKTSTGLPSPTFGQVGRVLWRPSNEDAAIHALKLRAIGTGQMQVLAGGYTWLGSTESAFVLRYDPNGYLDPNFGRLGYGNVAFGQTRERISDMELVGRRLDERIVAVGPSTDGLNWVRVHSVNALPNAPDWVALPRPGAVNLRSVRSGGNARAIQVTGDSGRMFRLIKTEEPGSPAPIFSWQRVEVGARFKSIRDFKTAGQATDFWAVGDSGFVTTSNTDGLHNSWLKRNASTRQRLNSVSGGTNQVAIAVGDSGLVLRSFTLGATFSKRRSGTKQRLNQVAGYQYIVGDSGIVLRSPDAGLTWARKPAGTTRSLKGIANQGDSLVLAVGDSGIILRSTDGGTSWAHIPLGDTSALYSVHIGPRKTGLIMACGANGLIIRSEDKGLTWKRQETGTTRTLRCILVDDSTQAIAVGDSGTVLRTTQGGVYMTSRGLIVQNREGLEFSLYPNPAGQSVTLHLPEAAAGPLRIEVLDLAGRPLRVLEEEVQANGAHSTAIELGSLPPGCYLVRIAGKAGQNTRKLMVR